MQEVIEYLAFLDADFNRQHTLSLKEDTSARVLSFAAVSTSYLLSFKAEFALSEDTLTISSEMKFCDLATLPQIKIVENGQI